MNIKQLALVLGATTLVVAGGLGAVACSSSSGNGGTGSGSGSGSGGHMDSGMGNDTGTNDDTGTGGDTGGGGDGGMTVDCGSIPTLHQNPAGDVYCGFGAEAGTHIECVADSGTGWCCLGGSLGGGQYAPQICGANSAACIADGNPEAGASGAGIPIQCNQLTDCPGNGSTGATACCLQGASAPAVVAGCGYAKSKGGSAIVCEGTGGGAATACAAGEVQICSSQTDCPTGTTCKPGKWKIYQIGFCQ